MVINGGRDHQLTGFTDFDHWWNYIIEQQPTQAIVDVLLLPHVKQAYKNTWNAMVKEEL